MAFRPSRKKVCCCLLQLQQPAAWPWAVLEGGKAPNSSAIERLKAGSNASLDPEAQQSTIPRNTQPDTFHPGNATATYFPFWSFGVFLRVCATRQLGHFTRCDLRVPPSPGSSCWPHSWLGALCNSFQQGAALPSSALETCQASILLALEQCCRRASATPSADSSIWPDFAATMRALV